MAVEAVIRVQSGTEKVVKSSGGDATMSFASISSGTYRQSTKIDFGATRAPFYNVFLDVEFAPTPTANKAVRIWVNPSSSATAGTDNRGGCSGTDSAYTGYSSNAADSVKQLDMVGTRTTTAQATSTVQRIYIGQYVPKARYGSVVFGHEAGVATHSSETNMKITFVPAEPVREPS